MVSANLLWALSYLTILFILWGGSSYIVYVIPSIIFCAGGVMAALGIYGLRRTYGSTMALATFIISMVFIWFTLIPEIIYLIMYPLGYPYYYTFFMVYYIMYYLGNALAGVMFILWGCTYLTTRAHLGNEGLAIAAGVLYIITGGFWCSMVLQLVGDIMLIPSGILAIILLLTAPGSK
jgi:hypothetical protein